MVMAGCIVMVACRGVVRQGWCKEGVSLAGCYLSSYVRLNLFVTRLGVLLGSKCCYVSVAVIPGPLVMLVLFVLIFPSLYVKPSYFGDFCFGGF